MKTVLLACLEIPKTGEHQTRMPKGQQFPKEEEEKGAVSIKSVWKGQGKILDDTEFRSLK